MTTCTMTAKSKQGNYNSGEIGEAFSKYFLVNSVHNFIPFQLSGTEIQQEYPSDTFE